MPKISYTSLLPQTEREALTVQSRVRRLGLALVVFGFVLLGVSVAIFFIRDISFRNNESAVELLTPGEELNIQMPIEEDKIHTDFMFVDWRIELGWNNVRYALEHNLFYAHLLNRTLVIPSEVHMRQCFHEAMCSILGRHIKDASTETDVGKNRWAMPIEYFIDLPNLKSKTKVLTVSEFFQLHLRRANAASNPVLANKIRGILGSYDLLDEFSTSSGRIASLVLDQIYYEGEMYTFLHEAPKGRIIVDDTAPIERLFVDYPSKSHNITLYAFVDMPNMAIDTSYQADAVSMPPQLWETQEGGHLYPYVEISRKHVNVEYREWDEDQYQATDSYISLGGFIQRWATPPFSDAVYLRLVGGPHRFGWQPMKFSTMEGRKLYSTIVFEWLRYSDKVFRIADMAWNRLMNLTDSHDILAFHLRRGDFSTIGWNGAMGDSKVAGKAVVKASVDLRIRYQNEQNAANKTGTLATKFFIATDDNSPEGLAPLYDAGAVRLMDLLSAPNHTDTSAIDYTMDDDSKTFWSLNFPLVAFGDWLGLVEQVICARSWFFVGTSWSSFTGGILNMRAHSGNNFTQSSYVDPWV